MPAIALPVSLNPRVLVLRRLAPMAITLGLWTVIITGVRLAISAL
jgi:hypothetical protein